MARRKITTEKVKEDLISEGYVLLSDYKRSSEKIKTLCPQGHTWYVRWNDWQQGHRCGYCSKRYSIDTEKVRNELQSKGFHLIGEYVNANIPIEARCPNGHITKFRWHRWIKKPTCTECGRRPSITSEKVKTNLKIEGYRLLTDNYINAQQHLKVKCPKGHYYEVTWTNWQQGHRCPICMSGRISVAEDNLASFFEFLQPERNNRKVLEGKELDIYFPDKKVAVEYCGLYWHCDGAPSESITPQYHRNKMDECLEKGIRLITIFEDEWVNHKEICLSRIKNALGVSKYRIYARHCEVREIDKQIAKEFLDRTHLQGYGACQKAFGLYYEERLVQVATFGLPTRYHTTKGVKTLELKRLASEPEHIIVGGAGKLFKAGLTYAREQKFAKVKSYCDMRWGTGILYERLGFKLTHETKYTIHYTDGKQKRYRNQTLATNKKKENTTEKDKASQKRLYKIYDCGHQTWEYEI